MKPTTNPLAAAVLLLLASAQALAASIPAASAQPALEFDFTADEGCDGSFTLSKNLSATNKCAAFSSQGNFGAQVSNLLARNVRLQLFSDSKCTPAKEVFSNATLPPGADECYADIAVANSVIVSLA